MNCKEKSELREFQKVENISWTGLKASLSMGKDFGKTTYYYVRDGKILKSFICTGKKGVTIYDIPYEIAKYVDSDAEIEKKLVSAVILNKKYGIMPRKWDELDTVVALERSGGSFKKSCFGHNWQHVECEEDNITNSDTSSHSQSTLF